VIFFEPDLLSTYVLAT